MIWETELWVNVVAGARNGVVVQFLVLHCISVEPGDLTQVTSRS